jgi:hypothetical protein
MDILYYSNYCKHSQTVLQNLSKTNLVDKISFICIDKRVRETNNQIYIILENGSKVIMPPNVHSVPALLLVKKNYHALFGDEILTHFKPYINNQQTIATKDNGEPMGYYLGGSSNHSNIVSEQFTFYDMTPDELSSKGKGGMRQLYNYVAANDETIFIPTPPDTYRPDKISSGITIDTLQQQRNEEIGKMDSGAPKLLSL